MEDSKIYVIHAYEGRYEGLYGLEDWEIVEGTEKDAEEIAREMSMDIMQNHSQIMNDFYSDATNEGLEPDSDEMEDYVEELIRDNIAYDLWMAKDIDYEYAKKLLEKDPRELVDIYCEIV